MLTAPLASKLLRQILEDYNYWPASEGDSPLKVSRSKVLADESLILSRDASMRRAAVKAADPTATGYKVPNRVVEPCTLAMCFGPKIIQAKAELDAASAGLSESNLTPVAGMEMPAEALEMLVQLYNAMQQLSNPRVYIVRDVPQNPPSIVLSQSGNKITAKITNYPIGGVVRFSYIENSQIIAEDNTSPYVATITKEGIIQCDVVTTAGTVASAQIQATYTPPATAPTTPPTATPPATIAPTPGPAFMDDPYTGFFITGESTEGESIIAGTLLVQTS
jgi:hypothetical protein